LGYTGIDNLVDKAFLLHDYQYNGFDPDLSKYRTRDEVLHDIVTVIEAILRNVKDWFREEWDQDLDKFYTITESDFKKLTTRSTT